MVRELEVKGDSLKAKAETPGHDIIGLLNQAYERPTQQSPLSAGVARWLDIPPIDYSPRYSMPKIDLPVKALPRERAVNLHTTGEDIFAKAKKAADGGEYCDLAIWWGTKFGMAPDAVEAASKNSDGTVYVKLKGPFDRAIDRDIAGGAMHIDGIHVNDGVQYRTKDNGDNSVVLSDIQGVTVRMHIKGCPLELDSQVKSVKFQKAADGTTYIDATMTNPTPGLAQRGLSKLGVQMPQEMHIYAKVGNDGIAHFDVQRTIREAWHGVHLEGRGAKILRAVLTGQDRIEHVAEQHPRAAEHARRYLKRVLEWHEKHSRRI